MPSSAAAGHRAVVSGEEEDERQKQVSWIRKRTAFSVCVKMGFQCGDLFSDVVTPFIYFYERYYNLRHSEATETGGASFLELTVGFLPDASCLISVPPELSNATTTLVGHLSASSAGVIAARTFAETDPAYQLPTWFDIVYGAHALIAVFVSMYVVHRGLPYLRHCLEPFRSKPKSGKTAETLQHTKNSTRVAAVRTDDEEHGGTKDGVLAEVIETEGLKLAYLKASKWMFWIEDFLGIVLSGSRFVHRCRLTGLTLRSVDQVLMLTQFLFSFAMLGCACCAQYLPACWLGRCVPLKTRAHPRDSFSHSHRGHPGRAHTPRRAAAQTRREARRRGEGGDHRPR